MIPPQSLEGSLLCPVFAEMEWYSTDLTKGVLADGAMQSNGCGTDDPPLVKGEPAGVQNLFVLDTSTGAPQLVSHSPVAGASPADANFDAASADLGHVIFDEAAPLTNDANQLPAGDDLLYDWSGGVINLVTYVNGQPVQGSLAGGSRGSALHAVSNDGSRIYFEYQNDLYLRENGNTVQVDASEAGGPGGGGQFMGASADGTKAFFTDDASAGLTSDTQANSGINLYMHDQSAPSGQRLTDLTPDAAPAVQGISGVSDDGSYVYFVANSNLGQGGGISTAGPNLFEWHNGTTTFIATLDSNGGVWTGAVAARRPGCPRTASSWRSRRTRA